MRKRPRPSIRVAPSGTGIVPDAPTAVIRRPSTITVWSLSTRSESIGMTVTFWMASTGSGEGGVGGVWARSGAEAAKARIPTAKFSLLTMEHLWPEIVWEPRLCHEALFRSRHRFGAPAFIAAARACSRGRGGRPRAGRGDGADAGEARGAAPGVDPVVSVHERGRASRASPSTSCTRPSKRVGISAETTIVRRRHPDRPRSSKAGSTAAPRSGGTRSARRRSSTPSPTSRTGSFSWRGGVPTCPRPRFPRSPASASPSSTATRTATRLTEPEGTRLRGREHRRGEPREGPGRRGGLRADGRPRGPVPPDELPGGGEDAAGDRNRAAPRAHAPLRRFAATCPAPSRSWTGSTRSWAG